MGEQEPLIQGEFSSGHLFRGGPGSTLGIERNNSPESVVGRVIPVGPIVQMREGKEFIVSVTGVVGQMES